MDALELSAQAEEEDDEVKSITEHIQASYEPTRTSKRIPASIMMHTIVNKAAPGMVI